MRRRSERSEWEYVGTTWRDRQLGGWDDDSIVRVQLENWDAFAAAVQEPSPMRHLPGPNDQPSTFDDYRFHNTIMSFAYVLARSAGGLDRIAILDWGGGLGQYGLIARALIPNVTVEYHCRDLPRLAAAGRIVQPTGTYHDSDDELVGATFDLVVSSSSLQYAPDWRSQLEALASAANGYLYVTRLPIVLIARSFVDIQRPYRYGYETEYSGWVLNRGEFLAAAENLGLHLVREFLIMEGHRADGAPAASESRGYLFVSPRRNSPD